ncbi:hypothetical protein [Azospirillum sp.]|uniref:hypothetical protein n=1 Tax=Azospirillum sp. TaxID=34012 RepID=UPI003D71E01C
MSKVFRFYNARTGAHFYTADTAERNSIIASMPDFGYEGVAFINFAGNAVARFRRRDTGAHFYTASSTERDYILQSLSSVYELEDYSAFNAYDTQESSALAPVYRFFDASSGNHFFTASEAERGAVVATLPKFQAEGVAFYVSVMPALPPVPTGSLDEDWYLRAYPDVREAVNAGTITVRTHYDVFGRQEGRLPNDMAALAGNDSFIAFDSAPGFVRVLNGGSGDDSLDGIDDHGVVGGTMMGGLSDADDRLFGESGDDTLYGAQNDTLDGGSGNDVYYIHSGGARVTEGRDGGTDTLTVREDSVSGAFNYTIPNNVEVMRLSVSGLANGARPTFTGTAGNDFIAGSSSSGALHITGGAGDDTLNGGAGGAIVDGGDGDDYLVAAAQYATGRITIVLTSKADTLDGGAGNDTLVAWCGDDRLTGGAGRDAVLIDIGAAPNTLWKDVSAPDIVSPISLSWTAGTTTVTDFTPGEDVLSFRHTTLSLGDIMARFQDRGGGTTAVQASFDTGELGLTLAGNQMPGTFTLVLEGLTKTQVSSGWFSLSSGSITSA